jgi:hypothetical protein
VAYLAWIAAPQLAFSLIEILCGVATPMTEADSRIVARMEIALEKAFRVFPNGGDHEIRKCVAEKLRLSAQERTVSFEELSTLADSLVRELSKQRSA